MRRYGHTWRKVRENVLERDGYECQINSDSCTKRATAVDHIVPSDAGGAMYDPANLRAACRNCNNARANRAKAAEGWRRSRTEVVLVVGPPGVDLMERVSPGPHDVVVDYQRLSEAVGGNHEAVMEARGQLLKRVRRGEIDAPRVWIASTNPAAESIFPHHRVKVVDPGNVEGPLAQRWYRAREPKEIHSRDW